MGVLPNFFKDMRDPYLDATVYICIVGVLPKIKDMSDPYLVAFSIFFGGGPPHFLRYERLISCAIIVCFVGVLPKEMEYERPIS